jgi:trk/ktr system potassium uptake protein
MKIIICGAGQVGFGIARYLSSGDSDIVVIDKNPDLINRITDVLDVQGITGLATQPNILAQAGANDADLILAVTRYDEVNMITCQVAHSIFNIPTKIARIRNQNYLDSSYANFFSRNHMPIDEIITPEVEVARSLMSFIDTPGVFDLVSLKEHRVKLVGVICGEKCPLLHTPLRQIGELFNDLNIMVVAIFRQGQPILPNANEQMLPDDEVYFLVETVKLNRAMMAFGHEELPSKRLIIAGGGMVGRTLGRLLCDKNSSEKFTIIEKDRAIAHKIAEEMQNKIILNANILESDIFEEINIKGNESFLAVTNNSETNILASLLAKRHGVARTITLITSKNFETLIAPLGIDAVINPHTITISSILRHIRQGKINAVHTLRENYGEIIEASITSNSMLVDIPLNEIKLPYGMMVISIIRGEEVIIPFGNVVIKNGDNVIFFAAQSVLKKAEQLLSVGLDYF